MTAVSKKITVIQTYPKLAITTTARYRFEINVWGMTF